MLGSQFYRGADCCVLVCDVTRPETLNTLENWRVQFLANADISHPENLTFALIGNKVDSKDRQVFDIFSQKIEIFNIGSELQDEMRIFL